MQTYHIIFPNIPLNLQFAWDDNLKFLHRERGGLFSPDGGEDSPWATPSTPVTPSSPPTPTEAEGDGLSYNQRSLQRWEKDEELGELSTISPVLYANTNFPNLKQDYPGECVCIYRQPVVFCFFKNHTQYIIILSQTGPVGVNKSWRSGGRFQLRTRLLIWY